MGGKMIEAIFSLLIFLQISTFCNPVPLSTSSRWIVNQSSGKRVKLACVNWVSHLQPMLGEGLEKKPISNIAKQISANGFNCVRFTWATFMFTRPHYYNLTVSQSLDRHNLAAAKTGISRNNPHILDMKIVELHQAVVNVLGKNNLMVVLDNHVSEPSWCCSDDDGNGFFGDRNFDPKEWVNGLTAVARTYKGNSAVVGMSLRNELRGSRQNEDDWYKYMQQGAKAIHTENPDILVIVSGLSYDTNLGFLKSKPFGLNLDNKLVYEAHWHTFGIRADKWTAQTNKLCASVTKTARDNYLFLTTGNNSFPLFLSEFGMDQRGKDEAENRYISCLLAEVAAQDVDWALWSFQGSYMLRKGKVNLEEYYGVMNIDWDIRPRNPSYVDRLQLIRQMNQELNPINPTNFIIFHPQSGQCVQIGKINVTLAKCTTASRWDFNQVDGLIKLAGSRKCLTLGGGDEAAIVSNDCFINWKLVSSSRLQLAAENGPGNFLCLEKNDSDNTIVIKKCLCVGDDLVDFPTCADNPQVQWFKFVPANV